jgi:hypothetical protein
LRSSGGSERKVNGKYESDLMSCDFARSTIENVVARIWYGCCCDTCRFDNSMLIGPACIMAQGKGRTLPLLATHNIEASVQDFRCADQWKNPLTRFDLGEAEDALHFVPCASRFRPSGCSLPLMASAGYKTEAMTSLSWNRVV